MISASDRENAVLLINEAIASGASCKKACWTVWIVNFNTSHVTVYPGRIKQQHCNSSYFFQYISCYGLSQPRCTGGRDRIQFQYISCYGLSKTLWLWYREKHHFNTSHVTVYRKTSVIDAIRYAHFNTSHVTVYLVVDNNLPKSRKFQYISCYGLSRDNDWILGRYHVFQYISCYGLSLRICSITGICRHFNTSHVTVYQKLTAQA